MNREKLSDDGSTETARERGGGEIEDGISRSNRKSGRGVQADDMTSSRAGGTPIFCYTAYAGWRPERGHPREHELQLDERRVCYDRRCFHTTASLKAWDDNSLTPREKTRAKEKDSKSAAGSGETRGREIEGQ